MILYICGHDFHYEMENLCRVFFPNEKITVSDTLPESGAPEVETYLDGASGGYSVRVRVNVGDKTETRSAEVPKTDEPEKDECERTMARELFSALSAVTVYTGHNRSTTLSEERVRNRYLRKIPRGEL